MKSELIKMFKYPSMIKSAAFCAASFAFLSVVFKSSFVLVPEATEVRICNILTCCYGIWFGPAGALGCAVGNLIGDLGGSLTLMSPGGFFGNFLSAFVPYKIWETLGSFLEDKSLELPSLSSKKAMLRYLLSSLCSVISCSAVLAFTFELYRAMPAVNTFAIIFINNLAAALLGIALFAAASRLPNSRRFYWRNQMKEESTFVFPKSDLRKVAVFSVVSLMLTVYVSVYMLCSGVSLTQMDAFGKLTPTIIFIVYTLIQFCLILSCRWTEDSSDVRGSILL